MRSQSMVHWAWTSALKDCGWDWLGSSCVYLDGPLFSPFCGDGKEKGDESCRSGGDDDDGDERSFEFESK